MSSGYSSVSKSTREGLLNVDKPGGMTSHDVVDRVRQASGMRRVGHAGTLDPLATGVLLVCVGRATRLLEYLVGRRKRYRATIRLGKTTETFDADGTLVKERSCGHVTADLLAEALSQFRGPIQQRPPMYSAVKQDGQPLYKLARQGITIERPLRDVVIYELELSDCNLPFLQLQISCSSGTYVRSLAHDLGEALGCGGHLAALRRTAVGDFGVDDAVSLADLAPDSFWAHLQSSDMAVQHLPRLHLTEGEWERLSYGQAIRRQAVHPEGTLVRAYNSGGRFVGIVAAKERLWRPRKIFHPDPAG